MPARTARASQSAAPEQLGARERLRTVGFEEEPPTARRLERDSTPTVDFDPTEVSVEASRESAPSLEFSRTGVGRETLAAIERELLEDTYPAESEPRLVSAEPRTEFDAIDAFEMVTFVLRGGDFASLATAELRRAFVAERLLHRLPVPTMDAVEQIDITPWTIRDTLILRVWCRVERP